MRVRESLSCYSLYVSRLFLYSALVHLAFISIYFTQASYYTSVSRFFFFFISVVHRTSILCACSCVGRET